MNWIVRNQWLDLSLDKTNTGSVLCSYIQVNQKTTTHCSSPKGIEIFASSGDLERAEGLDEAPAPLPVTLAGRERGYQEENWAWTVYIMYYIYRSYKSMFLYIVVDILWACFVWRVEGPLSIFILPGLGYTQSIPIDSMAWRFIVYMLWYLNLSWRDQFSISMINYWR